MANYLGFMILAIFCAVIQSTFIAYLGVGSLRIELMLLLLTYVALYHPLVSGAFLVFSIGYLYDLNSVAPMGLHIVSFLACFVVLYNIRSHLYIHGPTFCIGLAAAMVIFHDIVSSFFLLSRGVTAWTGWSQTALLVPKALLTGAMWPFLSSIMQALDKWFPLPYMGRASKGGLEFKV